MFARFDENPAMTLQDIKETKRYGRNCIMLQNYRRLTVLLSHLSVGQLDPEAQ